jgi:acetyl-CoA C-acetyltransferase
MDGGKFKDEIVPVTIPGKKGDIVYDTDEYPKRDVTLEGLAKLKPVFKEDGTVTAGNASGMNDAAAGVILVEEEKAKELGLPILARIVSVATTGVEPEIMGIGPVSSSRKALEKAGLKLEDIELFEINEAFAAQCVAVEKELGINREILNVNGGGISLGHPVGATGVRIVITLLYEMKRRGNRYGLATLCAGGGMGTTVIIEAL